MFINPSLWSNSCKLNSFNSFKPMYFGYFFSEEQSWSQTCSEETVLYRDDFKRPPCFVRVKWPVSYRACPLGTSREIYHWEPHQYVKVWMVPNFQCAWEWLRTVSDSRGLSFQAVSSLAHTVHFWFKIANRHLISGKAAGFPQGCQRAGPWGRAGDPARLARSTTTNEET